MRVIRYPGEEFGIEPLHDLYIPLVILLHDLPAVLIPVHTPHPQLKALVLQLHAQVQLLRDRHHLIRLEAEHPLDDLVQVHLLIRRGRRHPEFDKLLVQRRDVKLRPVVVDHDFSFFQQRMDLPQHGSFRLRLHRLVLQYPILIPFRTPTQDV